MLVSKDTIIFVHIPKTAGSTLGHIANRNYTNIFEFYRAKKPADTSLKDWISEFCEYNRDSNEDLAKPRFLRGHFGFGIDKFLQSKSCTYITILRDPVERVISHYYFSRAHQLNAATKMSLRKFVESRKFVITDNLQVRFISGFGWQSFAYKAFDLYNDEKFDIAYGECSSDILELAKSNLKNHFLFGLQNKMNDSLSLFGNILSWKKIRKQPMKNIGKNKLNRDEIDTSVIHLIREHNSLDIQLYEYAQDIFEKQYNVMAK